MPKKILVPTDGSEQAERAGEYAISTADITGADIILLYVIDTSYLKSIHQHDLRNQLKEELREEGERAVKGFDEKIEEQQCQGKCKTVKINPMIKEGNPADVILKTIAEKGVDQVIMGKSGKHGLEKFILGSTAEKVVRSAKIPVRVVP